MSSERTGGGHLCRRLSLVPSAERLLLTSCSDNLFDRRHVVDEVGEDVCVHGDGDDEGDRRSGNGQYRHRRPAEEHVTQEAVEHTDVAVVEQFRLVEHQPSWASETTSEGAPRPGPGTRDQEVIEVDSCPGDCGDRDDGGCGDPADERRGEETDSDGDGDEEV